MNPLEKALANLDLESTGMQSDAEFDGCERCYSAENLAALHGPDIPDEMVLEIFTGWLHRWTNHRVLVHSLTPKFLRLLVRGEIDSGLYTDVGKLLWDAGWTTWPERDAVHAVLQAWWRDKLDYDTLQFLIAASHEAMPWLPEFECDPAALPDLIDKWCFDLTFPDDLKFDPAEPIAWLFHQGLELLTRIPDPEGALRQLAETEYWLETMDRLPK